MRKFIALLFLLLLTSPADANVIVSVQTEYYGVPGKTKSELLRNMEAYAPERMGDYFVPAFTLPQVSYSYRWRQKDGRCSMSDVKIHLNLVYRYPRLAETPSSDYVQQWWDDLVNRYIIHEEIHGDIAIQGAHEMERELLSMEDMECGVIQQEVENRAEFLMREINRDQQDYDRVTRHGMQQENY